MGYSLDGKVALVTGASSGIGLAVSRKLVEAGGRVAMVARTQATLEKEAALLGERAVAFPLDVMDLAALAALPKKVVARFGALDIVVNNAGLNHRGPVRDHGPLALADVITTNLSRADRPLPRRARSPRRRRRDRQRRQHRRHGPGPRLNDCSTRCGQRSPTQRLARDGSC